MNAFRDRAQAAWAVIDGIHGCNHSEENLRRANVARGFVASDMLFACLQREPVTGSTGRIMGNADEPSGHVPFVGIACGEVSCVRSAESERHSEALRVAHGNVGAEFARRLE